MSLVDYADPRNYDIPCKPLKIFGDNKMITNSKKDEVKIWIRHEKSRYKHAFRIRLGTKMHKLFNA